jgi:hypothetical protein
MKFSSSLGRYDEEGEEGDWRKVKDEVPDIMTLYKLHICVDASDNNELYKVQEELQQLLSAGTSLPGLQHFGILVLNRDRANRGIAHDRSQRTLDPISSAS